MTQEWCTYGIAVTTCTLIVQTDGQTDMDNKNDGTLWQSSRKETKTLAEHFWRISNGHNIYHIWFSSQRLLQFSFNNHNTEKQM